MSEEKLLKYYGCNSLSEFIDTYLDCETAFDLLRSQFKEIERLNNIINESNKMIDKIVEEVYKPVDKEWDNILCIIEDYKLKLQKLKGSGKE